MSDIIQIKRRLGGVGVNTPAVPAGNGNEGELAAYLGNGAGATDKPALYISDGGGWRTLIDPNAIAGIPNHSATKTYATGDVVISGGQIYQAPGAVAAGAFSAAQWTKITNTGGVAVVGLNAGADQGSVQATFNNDAVTIPSAQVTVYSYSGTAYIYTGPVGAPVTGATAAQFTALGAAPTFALASDVTTGTDTAKVLNSKLLRDELVRAFGPVTAANLLAGKGATNAPDAAPTNDANKVVALDANGKIDLGFINLTGLNFLGAVDATGTPTAPTGGFKAGDIYFNNKAGTVDAGWTGIGGNTVSVGDMLIYDGTNWEAIAAEADLAKYLPLAGGTMTAGDTTSITFAPATTDGTVTVLDLGNGALDNAWIDGGTY